MLILKVGVGGSYPNAPLSVKMSIAHLLLCLQAQSVVKTYWYIYEVGMELMKWLKRVWS